MSTIAPAKRPEIKTAPCPARSGQEIVEADAQYVTPSYPRPSYKLVAEHAYGVWVRTLTATSFSTATPASPSARPATATPKSSRPFRIRPRRLIHMCGTDYYYRHMPELGAQARRDRARPLADAHALRQQRHRGRRDRAQARDARHRAREVHRLLQQLPRPHARLALAHLFEGRAAPRLQAPGARRGARPLPERLPPSLHRRADRRRDGQPRRVSTGSRSACSRRPRRPRRSPASSSRACRARAATSPRRSEFLAGPAPHLRRARHHAHRRRGAVRHGPHGQDVRLRPLRPQARHHHAGEGHRVGPADGRVRGARRPDGLEAGRARLDLRRQPRRHRRRAQDDRAARTRAGRQLAPRSARTCRTACAGSCRSTTASATCAGSG